MHSLDIEKTALILIDVQKGFLQWEAGGLRRNNKAAIGNIVRLLARCRTAKIKIFHIRHASSEPNSVFAPKCPGYFPMDEVIEQPGETVLVKHVNSAFIGTDLEKQLRQSGFKTLLIAGITTNHCVETTARMAGNLGFDTSLIEDACYTFDRTGPDGVHHTAEAIHQMTLNNLNGEFATITTTDKILTAILEIAA